MRSLAVDKSKYVVLDIETNGLYVSDDVLSISIYKPDDGVSFNKYLPLELSKRLNISVRQVRKIIDQLRNDGVLTRQGGDAGRWTIHDVHNI